MITDYPPWYQFTRPTIRRIGMQLSSTRMGLLMVPVKLVDSLVTIAQFLTMSKSSLDAVQCNDVHRLHDSVTGIGILIVTLKR